jgi:hypothetical protein
MNTTLPMLARNADPHHVPFNDTSRTDTDMSAHDRAIKLRNLTIGWYVGLPPFLPSLLSISPFIPSRLVPLPARLAPPHYQTPTTDLPALPLKIGPSASSSSALSSF